MNIKTKLSLGFLSLIILICVIAVIGITMLSKNFDRMSDVVEDEYQKIGLVSDIRYEFNNMAKSSSFLILAESKSTQKVEIDKIRDAQEKGVMAIERLERIIDTEAGLELLSTIRMNLTDFTQLINEEISLIQDGKEQEAADLVRGKGMKAIENAFFTSIFNLTNYYEVDMNTTLSETESENKQTTLIMTILSVIGIILGLVIALLITRGIVIGLKQVSNVMSDFSSGKSNMATRIHVIRNDEIGSVATSFNNMADALETQVVREHKISKKNEEQAWMTKNLADLTTYLQASNDLKSFSHNFIQKITPLVGAQHGVFYLNYQEDSQPILDLIADYAYKQHSGTPNRFNLGEGLIGQSALVKKSILITEVPEDYVRITSGIGEAAPNYIFVVPIVFENRVRAVFEIASFRPFSSIEQELVEKLADYSGIIIDNISGRIKMIELLQESQTMTEELQTQSEELSTQHDELKRFNDELEMQTKALIQSELTLQQQQEELEQTNVELEEKAGLLEEHNLKYETKNREVEQAKIELEEKAVQLELTSKYKSEFLANMSHELRTPLNSLLILSKLLADNKTKNLSDKQVEFAKTINSAGCDLLELINEILDLAKVESGKIEVELKDIKVQEIVDFVQRNFNPIAQDRGIDLEIIVEEDVEAILHTDEKRLQQILKNLLANAFKFTHNGSVLMKISRLNAEEVGGQVYNLAFSVIDTGIGIPKEKQSVIFEAFQQADGTTSRKYGGTGLGLSISREHAYALNGNIEVESEEGQGSTFTLLLPVNNGENLSAAFKETAVTQDDLLLYLKENQFETVNNHITQSDTMQKNQIINIEDKENQPEDHPTELVDMQEEKKEKFFDEKKILIVDDDVRNVFALTSILEEYDMDVQFAENGKEALDLLNKTQDIDLVLMDIMMPVMDGFEAISKIREMEQYKQLPIIALTAKAMKEDREKCIAVGASDYISKPVINHQLLSLMRVWLYK
ncbi:MAG: response regulator [Paenisporosarcina sp.]